MFSFDTYGIKKEEVSLLFSTKCNMDCSYCYIPKDKKMEETNKEVREFIISGNYANEIANLSDDIRKISLWGAEPTLNYDLTKILFTNILSKNKSVEEIFFSTNILIIKVTAPFILI